MAAPRGRAQQPLACDDVNRPTSANSEQRLVFPRLGASLAVSAPLPAQVSI